MFLKFHIYWKAIQNWQNSFKISYGIAYNYPESLSMPSSYNFNLMH